MKPNISNIIGWQRATQTCIKLAAAASVSWVASSALAATTTVNLGSASSFAVLADSGITFIGPVGSIPIYGNIGSAPTAALTGLGNITLTGTNHDGNAITQVAKTDLAAAYADAAGRSATINYGPIFDMGGLFLLPGVYNGSSSLAITGSLTLDALGDSDAVWIFQSGSTLVANSGSQVILTGGAKAENVFWQVGSSATFDTNSQFAGSVLALTSITANTGATVAGRLMAINGAVTMGGSAIVIPEPSSCLLAGAGLLVWLLRRQRPDAPMPDTDCAERISQNVIRRK